MSYATILIAGCTIVAPADLVAAAGYVPYANSEAPSRSTTPAAEYRLMRAMSELHVSTDCIGRHAVVLLLRAVALAEEERTVNLVATSTRQAAELQAKAAADERSAAGIAHATEKLARKS